ncbi:MAG: hypothetical protein ABL871_15215 [Terricaulis sp.]
MTDAEVRAEPHFENGYLDLRGHYLRQISPLMPEDSIGIERFHCDGSWSAQSRVMHIGNYFRDGVRVCVKPNGQENAHCRAFEPGPEFGRVRSRDFPLAQGSHNEGAVYEIIPLEGGPC